MKNLKPMSDKDFDKIFQEKLYSLEVEPAEAVWAGISEHLSKKKKRTFPVLWLAAASMAIVVGTGVWLSSQKEPMKLTGNMSAETISKKPDIKQPSLLSDTPEKSSPINLKKAEVPIKTLAKVDTKTKRTKTSLKSHSGLASTSTKVEVKPAVEAIDESLNSSEMAGNMSKHTHTLALASEPAALVEEPQMKPRKIKSVGSLVNFVVSKVDKRKNKIIEFEDNDEGTKVSGLNLGLLKFQTKE